MGDQMEAFEVTDYDLESEFNPHARRGFRQTREEAIYGVFADDSGDEKPGPSKPKRKPNYTAPLGFVKGGIHQVGKDAPVTKKSDDEDDEGDGPPPGSSDEEDEAAPRLGAGLPRAFGSAPKQRRFQASSGAGPSRDEIAGMRSTGGAGPTVGLGDIGHWEKHTKGIGAKLLKQMGFREGGGLGKNLQGISTPVEAKLRKGRGAIGAYGTEKPASRPIPGGAEKTSDEPEREFKEKLGQWRRGPRRKKVDYVYKTLDEVLQEGKTRTLKSGVSSSSDDLARTKVIDMTGREQRVLSGYHAIHGQRAPAETAADDDPKKTFDMPELLHNINLMVDICEQDIIRSDRALRYEKDRQVTLEHEESQLSESIERSKSQLERVEDVSRAVDYLEKHKPGTPNASPLEVATKVFIKLKTDYPIEYAVFDLDYLAVDYIFPLVKDLLKAWSPLKNPKFATDVFSELKEALESSDKPQLEQGTPVDVYHRLLWELWMPPVRGAVSLWQPKQQPELTQLLELWRPLLPRWVLENICDQLLMPRLQTEVDAWNPLTDAVPIHSWIHPWMPIMDQRLESVYPTIRHKLANALLAWHPSDRSARLILAPWVGVMAPGSLEAFLVKNILPKLQLAMSELVINPHQQVLDQWNWVMDWEELISPVHLVSILDKIFFPKWLQVLVTWLNHAPNYEEVTKWYLGWKMIMPEKLVGHAVVREHLNTGLQLMNRAASNPGQAVTYQELGQILAGSTPPPPPPPQPVPTPSQVRNREDLSAAIRTASGSVTIGFRELLERRCGERGILFHPLPGKFHEGKPVLRCGGLSIYLDRSVIFVNENGVWVPSSLQSVLDKAALTGV